MNLKITFFVTLIILSSLTLSFAKNVELLFIDKDIGITLEGVNVIIESNNNSYTSNKSGIVIIPVDDNVTILKGVCSLSGYESKQIIIKEFNKKIEVNLSIEGVLEGVEIVIKRKRLKKIIDNRFDGHGRYVKDLGKDSFNGESRIKFGDKNDNPGNQGVNFFLINQKRIEDGRLNDPNKLEKINILRREDGRPEKKFSSQKDSF